MKINDLTSEAYSIGKMPAVDEKNYTSAGSELLSQAKKVADVNQSTSIYKHNNRYLLVKNNQTVIGHMDLTPISIKSKKYLSVDGLYVLPSYQKTTATSWLLYGVKELVTLPVIADGAIFKDGTTLIKSIEKNKIFNVSVLNKITGERIPFAHEINDNNMCYLFDATNLGFTKTILEGIDPVWLPLFEDF